MQDHNPLFAQSVAQGNKNPQYLSSVQDHFNVFHFTLNSSLKIWILAFGISSLLPALFQIFSQGRTDKASSYSDCNCSVLHMQVDSFTTKLHGEDVHYQANEGGGR